MSLRLSLREKPHGVTASWNSGPGKMPWWRRHKDFFEHQNKQNKNKNLN